MSMQQFCLRWNNHQPNFISVFTNLLNNVSLVDVTLAAEGKHLQAHKVVLSACSSYFQTLFTVNPCQHPIVILKDVKFDDLKIMVDFMYSGEVNVSQEQLPAILKTAEMLKIKGLAEMPDQSRSSSMNKSQSMSSDRGDLLTPGESTWESSRRSPSPLSPSAKRKRLRKSSTGSGSGSTERTSEDIPSEITLVPSPALIKPEPLSYSQDGENCARSDSSLRNSTQEPSTDSEPREGSQDSAEDDHLALHMSQDSSTGLDASISDGGPSTSLQTTPQASTTSGKSVKRLRPLIRQQRIKKELDPLHTSPETEPDLQHLSSSTSVLTVPHRVERQCSEPLPSISTMTRTPSQNFLSVPTPLIKQHSDPLLPSHSSTNTTPATFLVHRQLSQQSTQLIPPTLNVHLADNSIKQETTVRALSPSVVIEQLPPLPVLRVIPDHGETSRSSTSTLSVKADELRRASSSPQMSTTAQPPTFLVQRQLSQPTVGPLHQPTPPPPPLHVHLVDDNVLKQVTSVQVKSPIVLEQLTPLPVLRVIPDQMKGEELKRSASSPQSSTSRESTEPSRSGHCPVQRPGPALGCNFCWNTIDGRGRILRRKTQYHCPECQTNLCIVPCFQLYHEKHASTDNKEPQRAVSPSCLKILPKTSSI